MSGDPNPDDRHDNWFSAPEYASQKENLARLRACDPRLLKRLGVRREVCEAAARRVHEQEPGA